MAGKANERGERTRARLLEAGMELFQQLTAAQLLEALSARVVTRHVGMTTGAFYQHFPDHASYVDALVEYGLSRQPDEDRVATVSFEKIIEYVNAPDTHLVDDFLEFLEFNFRECVGIANVYNFVFALWTRRDDPRLMALLRRRYRLFMDDYIAAERMISSRWNMQYREPFTLEVAGELMDAFLEGALIRHCLEPDLITPEIYSRGILAFLTGALKPAGASDEPDILDFAHRLGVRDWEPPADHPTPRMSAVIVDAATALLATTDMDRCSVEEIANEAGVTKEHVYGTWGSRARLATAVVAHAAEPLGAQLALDLELPLPGDRALDRQLGRLVAMFVDLARTRPALLSLAMRGSVEHLARPTKHEGNLGLVLVPAIEAAQRDGAIGEAVDAATLARSIGFTVASLALEGPGSSPDETLQAARIVFGIKQPSAGRTRAARPSRRSAP